ncbi:hypothetical protein LCGC14_1497060 [marine sediment metagenome]|uniref:Uncharacterized protein n=1 Tax=marine sediment metagenome TaxID=412755 RepID=A0A0F9J5S1_9ZZZZ
MSGRNREGEHKQIIVQVSKLKTDIKTGGHNYPRDKSIGNLLTGWVVSGIEMARARFRRFNGTVGTRIHDAKGEHQVKKSKMQSTDAWFEDGLVRSSDDGPVMGSERRSRVASADSMANFILG